MTLRSDVSLTQTVEGGFLLDKRTGQCFSVNRVGVQVLNELRNGKSRDEILLGLHTRYGGVPAVTITADLSAFMALLDTSALLVE
jgi:hypothetical protein